MAIKVRALDKNNDWTFGSNIANYINNDNAIIQNVKTRLKSLKNDFFLDSEANIDWFGILSELNNQEIVINEIYRVTLDTDGVIEIKDIQVVKLDKRDVTISLEFATINTERIKVELGLIDKPTQVSFTTSNSEKEIFVANTETIIDGGNPSSNYETVLNGGSF